MSWPRIPRTRSAFAARPASPPASRTPTWCRFSTTPHGRSGRTSRWSTPWAERSLIGSRRELWTISTRAGSPASCSGRWEPFTPQVIHRDVKPSNVLLDPDGNARLTDFGIARPEDATELTGTGQVLGTLKYMAPEVLAGNPATERSDVYALGVVLGECLTGRVAPQLKALINRLTAADPQEPPASATQAMGLLETYGQRRTTATVPLGAASDSSGSKVIEVNAKRVIAVIAVLAIAGILVAVALAGGGSGHAPSASARDTSAKPPTTTSTYTSPSTATATSSEGPTISTDSPPSTATEGKPPRKRSRPGGQTRECPAWAGEEGLERHDLRFDPALTPRTVHRDRDPQVLDREAGRVEQRDLVVRPPPLRTAHDHVAELGHLIPAHGARGHAAGQLAASSGLCPLVAEQAAPLDRRQLDLGLPLRVGAQRRQMLARTQIRFTDDHAVARRHGHDDVLDGRVSTISRAPAQLRRERLGSLEPHVRAHAGAVAGAREATRGPGAVHAAPDDPHRARLRRREHLRRERGGGPRAQRRDRGAVDDRHELAGLRIRQQQRAGDDGQAALRVSRERRHPLERRESLAPSRHRPEVAVRWRIEVDLGRHRPVAAGVSLERQAHAFDRERRLDRRHERVAVQDRNLRHGAEVRVPTMSRNGERRPPRPKIRLLTQAASEGEAAAVVAAVERFLADTAPAPPPAASAQSRWQRAALLEGVSRAQLIAWGSDSG